jgi:hypothetical protein
MWLGSWSLKETPEAPAGSVRTGPGTEARDDRGVRLACSACLQPITTTAARIVVAGDHDHTFTNPEGIRFRIGCFSDATNCAVVGPPSSYWTWFPSYSWQIEICAACRQHLGWLFRGTGDRFHGLILDRLVELTNGQQ